MSGRDCVRVRVAGPYACFSRPEMKVERVSYEVMTPSAARGLLEAILWHPEIRWVVRRIEVLRPVRFAAVRRNEVQSKIAPRSVNGWISAPSTYKPFPAGAGSEEATPRNTLALRDVAYVIEAEPHVYQPNGQNSPIKYREMFQRRVEKGQCFHRPYLGCREFACSFAPPDDSEHPITETRDLGLMLYDVTIRPGNVGNQPVFFAARLETGVLDTTPERVLSDPVQREEVLLCSCKR